MQMTRLLFAEGSRPDGDPDLIKRLRRKGNADLNEAPETKSKVSPHQRIPPLPIELTDLRTLLSRPPASYQLLCCLLNHDTRRCVLTQLSNFPPPFKVPVRYFLNRL